MSKGIEYRGVLVMPGSTGHRLASEKKEGWEKQLKEHHAALDAKEKELLAAATRAEERGRNAS